MDATSPVRSTYQCLNGGMYWQVAPFDLLTEYAVCWQVSQPQDIRAHLRAAAFASELGPFDRSSTYQLQVSKWEHVFVTVAVVVVLAGMCQYAHINRDSRKWTDE